MRMMRRENNGYLRIVAVLGVMVGMFIFTGAALAQRNHRSTNFGLEETLKPENAGLVSGPTDGDQTILPELVGRIIGVALSLIAVVFFLLILYAGITWMLDRGKEERAKTAIGIIYSAIIGIILVMASYALTRFVLRSARPNICSAQSPVCAGEEVGASCSLSDGVEGVCGLATEGAGDLCTCNPAPSGERGALPGPNSEEFVGPPAP